MLSLKSQTFGMPFHETEGRQSESVRSRSTAWNATLSGHSPDDQASRCGAVSGITVWLPVGYP